MITEFPPVTDADEHGLLAIGGDLETESLLLAYRSGIFPWPFDERTLAWFSPSSRALLFLSELHVSRSLEREARKTNLSFSTNRAFSEVMKGCAKTKNRKRGKGTWITKAMIEGYTALHNAGYAHSVEVWNKDLLVGGIYGVSIGQLFSAESMFYAEPNASKLALLKLTQILSAQGVEWIDCQVLNPFTESLGAREVPREEYERLLSEAIKKPPVNFTYSPSEKS